jgi:hypothetical protein
MSETLLRRAEMTTVQSKGIDQGAINVTVGGTKIVMTSAYSLTNGVCRHFLF